MWDNIREMVDKPIMFLFELFWSQMVFYGNNILTTKKKKNNTHSYSTRVTLLGTEMKDFIAEMKRLI